MKKIELVDFDASITGVDLSEPITIAYDGEPIFVIESYSAFRERQEVLLGHELALGEEDIKQGRTMDSDEFKAFIEELKAK